MGPKVFHYGVSFLRTDKSWMLCLIGALYVLDTAHSTFAMISTYHLSIHLGDVNFLTSSSWDFQMIAWLSAVMGLVVQFFYAWRVRVMLNSIAVAGLVGLCALASFAGAIVMGVIAAKNQPGFWVFTDYETGLILWLAGSAVTDVLISTVLIWHLRHHKPGIKRTDDVIDRIIRILWQTFAVTSLCAIIDVILYLTLANDGAYYIVFHYLLPKLYVISLLSSINSRKSLSQSISSMHTSVPSLTFNFAQHDHALRHADGGPPPVRLSVVVQESFGHVRAGSDGSDNTMIDCESPTTKKCDVETV